MKVIFIIITIICLSVYSNASYATTKIYLIHGYGGIGVEMREIQKSIEKKGFISEIYSYPSLTQDVDSVGNTLYRKVQSENFDTVMFVTHSMGALVVRSLYEHIDSLSTFPFIHRIVMIAPPNNGSPVADFFAQFSFVKHIIGPNINNITTNPLSGASKYPIPSCEVGLIAGSFARKRGFNIFVKGDNDGVLRPEQTKMGIEKDVAFIKSWHVGLLYNKTVQNYTSSFLTTGKFK